MNSRSALAAFLAAAALIAILALRWSGGAEPADRTRAGDPARTTERAGRAAELEATNAETRGQRVPDAAREGAAAGATVAGSLSPPGPAEVELLEHGTGEVVRRSVSDAFRFEGLDAGAFTVRADRRGQVSPVRTIELAAGELRELDLRFEPETVVEVLAARDRLPRRKWPRELRVVATPWHPEAGRAIAGLLRTQGNRFGIGRLAWDHESSALDGVRRVGDLTVDRDGPFWVSLVRHTTTVATAGPFEPGVESVTLPWDGPTWSGRRSVRVLAEDREASRVRLVAPDRWLESANFSRGVAEIEDVLPGEYFLEATGSWGLWATSLLVEPGSGPVTARVPDGPARRVHITCTDATTGAPIEFPPDSSLLERARFELVPADASLPYELASANVNLRPFGGQATELRLLPGRFHLRLVERNLQSGTVLVDTRAGDVQVSVPCAPR